MRLPECSDAGEFGLTEYFVNDDEIPPYAILSHTWVAGEEVVYEELKDGAGKGKSGYPCIRAIFPSPLNPLLRYPRHAFDSACMAFNLWQVTLSLADFPSALPEAGCRPRIYYFKHCYQALLKQRDCQR